MLHRFLVLPLFAAIAVAACSQSEATDSSHDEVSAVHQAQIATRVFRKLIGRDPSPSEIAQLRNASLEQMVDTVLDLPDFERDGFFAFQRDRLLLHRDGDSSWLQNSMGDYCALRLDMQDVAKSDKSGAGGYYEMLRYRDRWVPVTRSSLGMPLTCAGVKVGELKAAMSGGSSGGDVGQCASSLKNKQPFRAEFDALDASFDDKPMLSTEPAQKHVRTAVATATFRPMQGAALSIELPLNESGMPQLLGYKGEANDRCETTTTIDKNAEYVFLKVRVPAEMEGVHGSMYWLSRHPSTKKNRDLHRARMIFFSYMCTEISPAMATVTGGDPEEISELKPFFDPEDEHVKTSANCYNCHTQVQPLANYFGEMTKGADYSPSEEDGGFFPGFSSYVHTGDGFRRPGGLWKGTKFHEPGAGKFGMEGLAELLSTLDSGHDCVVRNTWTSLIGTGHAMTDKERAEAVKAFGGTDGTFRFRALLKHLILQNERGKAFFDAGEKGLDDKQPASNVDCRDIANVPPESMDAPETLMMDNCAGCHTQNATRGFYEKDAAGQRFWKPERLVGDGKRYKDVAEFYNLAYCRVLDSSMPLGGWDESDGVASDAKRQKTLCYLAGKRNEAARASSDPTIRGLDSAPCEGQVVPPNNIPHPIQ